MLTKYFLDDLELIYIHHQNCDLRNHISYNFCIVGKQKLQQQLVSHHKPKATRFLNHFS
jgi:hypothetical protein